MLHSLNALVVFETGRFQKQTCEKRFSFVVKSEDTIFLETMRRFRDVVKSPLDSESYRSSLHEMDTSSLLLVRSKVHPSQSESEILAVATTNPPTLGTPCPVHSHHRPSKQNVLLHQATGLSSSSSSSSFYHYYRVIHELICS
jgi:hypothetical protein